jgi:hypothetical protein
MFRFLFKSVVFLSVLAFFGLAGMAFFANLDPVQKRETLQVQID